MIEPPKNRQKEANYIHSLACRAEPCVRNLHTFRCLACARHDKGNDVYLSCWTQWSISPIFRCLAFARHDKGNDCRMDIIGFFLPVFRCCLSVVLSLNINILSPFVARKEQSARHREKSVVHSSCSRVASDLPRSSLPWHKMLSFEFWVLRN